MLRIISNLYSGKTLMKYGWIAVIISLASVSQVSAKPVWTSLFDGKTLEGWSNPFEWGEVSVEQNEIVLRGDRKYFLVSDAVYKDFELETEVFVPEGGNSCIQFRCHYHKNRLWGYQAEVDTSDRRWAGGLYEEGRRGWLVPLQGQEEALSLIHI